MLSSRVTLCLCKESVNESDESLIRLILCGWLERRWVRFNQIIWDSHSLHSSNLSRACSPARQDSRRSRVLVDSKVSKNCVAKDCELIYRQDIGTERHNTKILRMSKRDAHNGAAVTASSEKNWKTSLESLESWHKDGADLRVSLEDEDVTPELRGAHLVASHDRVPSARLDHAQRSGLQSQPLVHDVQAGGEKLARKLCGGVHFCPLGYCSTLFTVAISSALSSNN